MRESARVALVEWLAARLGWAEPRAEVTRIGTGHSRAMFVVTPAGDHHGDRDRVVVRMEQGGVFGTSGAEERRVMTALRALGVPVAEVLAAEDTGQVTGHPFFVMAHVEGADTGADERAVDETTAAAFVDALHAVHRLPADPAVDPARLGFDIVPGISAEATARQVERWHRTYRSASDEPIPLLEEAAAWLTHRAPPLDELAVVHGDAGPGNFVHVGGRVVAITDWEFAHLGDPVEDWSFCLAMRGARSLPRDTWLALFRDRAGVDLDDDAWRYWEAFNLYKGACANRTCLALYESGVNPAPNMAIIGTALHQVFLRRLVGIVHG